jgi:hypothetical protein
MGGIAKDKQHKKNQLNPVTKLQNKKNQKWSGKTNKATQGKQLFTYALVAGLLLAGGVVAFHAYRKA